MDFILYTTISWIILSNFIINVKKREFVKIITFYLILIFIISIIYGIISNNMQLITTTKDKAKYLDVLLRRNIITPFLLLKLNSGNNDFEATRKKAISILLSLISLSILDLLDIKFELHKYVRWNFFDFIILNSFFIFITLMMNRYYYAIVQLGEEK